ncbi:MAG: 16S rRNA (uracil(1498)-N(3))-methyltransferase [Congregibacter sp.]
MNLLLFETHERQGDRVWLEDRRYRHLKEVLKVAVGDRVRVGEINGLMGSGEVTECEAQSIALRVDLTEPPPKPVPVTLILALPRPKALRRVLRSVTELGVKDIHLIHSFKVEKSYWQSPLTSDEAAQAALMEGLEQGMDTILPSLRTHRRFRPFAEDVLPSLCRNKAAYYADPRSAQTLSAAPEAQQLLIVGPDTGFIPFEEELIRQAGALSVHLGSRILRVETAVISALGSLRLIDGEAC